jgi:hypothetical protein
MGNHSISLNLANKGFKWGAKEQEHEVEQALGFPANALLPGVFPLPFRGHVGICFHHQLRRQIMESEAVLEG